MPEAAAPEQSQAETRTFQAEVSRLLASSDDPLRLVYLLASILSLEMQKEQSLLEAGTRAGTVTLTGAAFANNAVIVPKIITSTPIQIHGTIGFKWAFMMGLPVSGLMPS